MEYIKIEELEQKTQSVKIVKRNCVFELGNNVDKLTLDGWVISGNVVVAISPVGQDIYLATMTKWEH